MKSVTYRCESKWMPLDMRDWRTLEEDVLPRLHLEPRLLHLKLDHLLTIKGTIKFSNLLD